MILASNKYFAVLRTNWIQALEYRANALVGVIAIMSGLFIEYQIWSLIFITQGYESIKGFTFEELIVFIFLSIIIGQLKSSWHSSSEMIRAIRTGEINKYLIRPISYFWYHFMMFIGFNSLYYIVYTIILIFFVFIFPGFLFPTILHVLGFLISLILSIYLSYCIYFIMVCFAFWFGEVRAIVVAYNISMTIISGQYIPIRLFPEHIINIMEFTPLLYLVDFPVSTAVGLFSLNEWLYNFLFSISWCVILTFACFIIYKKGVSKYEAYGQ